MPSALPRVALVALLTLGLAACSSAGGLSPGLSQRMDTPGAQLNRVDALGIINQYRSATGAAALTDDPTLDAQAQSLAAQYMTSGKQPARPAGAVEIRYSAGYFPFAEPFSGWRTSPADAAALSNGSATRAGVAVVSGNNSPYGVYWVLILG